jgi:hypothetical protein
MTYPDYFATSDVPALLKACPIGDAFTARYLGMSADAAFRAERPRGRRGRKAT